MSVQVNQEIMEQMVGMRDNAENNRASSAAQAIVSTENETYWEAKRDYFDAILADLEVV